MKKYVVLILFIFFLSFCYKSAYSQFFRISNRVLLGGFIYDDGDQKALPYVNVYIKHARIGTITDTAGHFVISAGIKDTLVLSCLGYVTKYIFISEETVEKSEPLIIFMTTRVYELKSVNIIALKRQKMFEYDLMNMKPQDQALENAKNNFPFAPIDNTITKYQSLSNVAAFVVSPISAFYDAFSKEGKERRKLEKIKEEDNANQLILSKMNYEIIRNITGMSKDQTDIFLYWCDFNTNFLNSLNDYDFIILVSKKYTDYKLYLKRQNLYYGDF